ncbi:MAG: hypothetical protein HQM08_30215 [Candidatus Riflebacteria bacterium]|nr:hypothetical protein [Candidatus Riflebacteria bacterium]
MKDFLIPLKDVCDSKIAGGKAFGLARASKAGFRVPLSLVIPTNVFSLNGSGNLNVPSVLIDSIVTEFSGCNSLAVRSSADVEDGPFISFAGQLKSVIGLPLKPDKVREAIVECWNAFRSTTFRTYCKQFGINQDSVNLALLVQPVVEARFSGVTFSVDPIDVSPNTIIEAVEGIGEKLVSGETIGSQYRVPLDFKFEKITDPISSANNLSGHPHVNLSIKGTPDFPRNVLFSRETCSGKSLLSSLQIQTIAEAARKLQTLFGTPVDVEWAWDAKGLVILQVRSITALEAPPNPKINWSRELTAERYPLPMSPLGWSNIRLVFDKGVRCFAEFMNISLKADEEFATLWNGWVFANADVFNFKDKLKIKLLFSEQVTLLKDFAPHLLGSPTPLKELRSLIKFIQAPGTFRTKLGNKLNSIILWIAGKTILTFLKRTASSIEKSWPTILAHFLSEVEAVKTAINTSQTAEELLFLGDRLQKAMIDYIRPDLVIFSVKEIASLSLSELAILAGSKNPRNIPSLLGKHLSENVTLQFHQEARLLGQQIKLHKKNAPQDSPKPEKPNMVCRTMPSHDLGNLNLGICELKNRNRVNKAFENQHNEYYNLENQIENFLEKFGHLSLSWDILNPTWGEDRERFLKLITEIPHPTSNFKLRSSVNPENVDPEITDFFTRLEFKPFALEFSHEMTQILRTFMSIDEAHHFHMGRILQPTRNLVLKLGKILVDRGILNDPQFIFWLTDAEVRADIASSSAKNRMPLCHVRKNAYERALRDGPPAVQVSIPLPIAPEKENEFLLKGKGVSPGSGKGKIRKVLSIEELSQLKDGEILLVISPDPAFSVVFPRLAGIIAETGALLSHSAVAAREYHLPAVFSVNNAYRIIPDGAFAEINGTQGTISLVCSPNLP